MTKDNMSTEEVIDILKGIIFGGFDRTTRKERQAINLAIKVLEERPQGEWVKIFENPFTNGYVCPFCGHKIQVTEQFLPKVTECENCGADMRGKE